MKSFHTLIVLAWVLFSTFCPQVLAQEKISPQQFLRLLTTSQELSAELELTDEQAAKLRKLSTKSYFSQKEIKEIREIQKKITEREEKKGSTRIEIFQATSAAMRKYDKKRNKFKDILLPHQIKRIHELYNAIRYRGYFYSDPFGLSLPLNAAEELQLTAREKAQVKKAIERVAPNLEAELRQLEVDFFKKFVRELSEKQKNKLDSTLGKIIDFRDVEKEIQNSTTNSISDIPKQEPGR